MTIKRLNYFQHQFLQVGEFQDEQTYHRDMRHLHNRYQHGSGIVEGLRVTGSSRSVTLERGVAIDKQGREIIIEADVVITIPDRSNAVFYMVIAYRDDDEDEDYASTQPGMTDKFTRTVETYQISWPAGAPVEGENNLILARLTTDAQGNLDGNPDLSVRAEAAIRMGEGSPAAELNFRLKDRHRDEWPGIKAAERSPAADGRQDLAVDAHKTSFSGDVEVGGTLHVSTIENQTDLRIDDNIITVNNYPPRPTPRTVNGGLEVFRGGTAPNAQVIWNETRDRWQAGQEGSLDDVTLAGDVAARFHPTSGHRHRGTTDDGPRISHSDLSNVQAAEPTSTNTEQDKHISNSQAKTWQDHITETGNPHGASHSHLADVQGVVPTSTNATLDKHVSNAQAKAWQDHISLTGNPHGASHADLANVQGVVLTSTNVALDKHVSNAQAKAWQDHVTHKNNPHGTTAAMIGALPSTAYDFQKSVFGAFFFNQDNANGATKTVTTNFKVKFIWLIGGVEAEFGGSNYQFGSAISGFADLRDGTKQYCNGVDIRRLNSAPYWSVAAPDSTSLCWVHFRDETTSPDRDNTLSVGVSSSTNTGIVVRLSRSVSTTANFDQLSQFTVRARILCFG